VTSAIVVLSGGGAKAAAHCGAMKALAERGIVPARFVATSMGAVVAAGLASGMEPDVLVRTLMHEASPGLRPHPLAALAGLHLPGLLRPLPFRAAIGRIIAARTFAELRIPLTITAADVDRIESVVLGAGGLDVPLLDALCATCALPPYLPAVTIEGRACRDGGLMGHLPLQAVGETGGLPVIAVDVGPGLDNGRDPRPEAAGPALVRAVDESIGILMAQGAADQLARWRLERGPLVYVRPRTERNVTFRVDRARVYAEEGYLATRAALDALAPAR
jgi:predicted acylesterase/phospholipase RssA